MRLTVARTSIPAPPLPLRAAIATVAAWVGLQLQADEVTNVAIIVAWIIGGLADIGRELTRRRKARGGQHG
jgi:hypothetical protein